MTNDKVREAIALFGFDRSTVVAPLRESTDNSVFAVGDDKDKKILRVSKRLPIEDATFECRVVNYLAEKGVVVPRFLPALSGEFYVIVDGDVAVMFDFIVGHHIPVDKDNFPNSSQAFEAGKGLAQIHNAGDGFQSSLPRHRTVFSELERVAPLRDVFESQFEQILSNKRSRCLNLGKCIKV